MKEMMGLMTKEMGVEENTEAIGEIGRQDGRNRGESVGENCLDHPQGHSSSARAYVCRFLSTDKGPDRSILSR